MLKRIAWLAPAVALLLVAGAVPVFSQGPEAAQAVHTVQLTARGPGGEGAMLRFEVAAVSQGEAREAALAALAELSPAADVLGDDAASAQWLPWSWKWAAGEIPVPVAYNPTGAPAAVGPPIIVAGLQAWSSTGQSAFAFRYAGITENTASILEVGPDGENVVSWASLACDQGCVLGVTSKQDAHEVDMLLNSNPQAAEQLGVGSAVDWRTVILHEFGHMAGLEHSCPAPFGPCTPAEADAVMYFQYRGTLRKLAADDVAGIAALYPLGTPPPSATPGPGATPTPFPELTVLLESGWNLVVLPSGPIENAASGLACLEALYSWEAEEWTAWIRGVNPSLQGLSSLEPGRAYWGWTTESCAHVFP
jgi:hypothetical protein